MPTAPKTTTPRTKKAVAPKVPQDRKPKEEVTRIEDTPGWDLMKPFTDIPVWEQTPLVAQLQTAFESEDDEDGPTDEEIDAMSEEEYEAFDKKRRKEARKSFDINIVGQLAQSLLPYAKDEAAYTKFVSGPGALERAMNLAMAWVGQMGESTSSEN